MNRPVFDPSFRLAAEVNSHVDAKIGGGLTQRHLRWTVMVGCSLCVAALIALAFYARSHDPNSQDLAQKLRPPIWQASGGWSHPLGTDHLGRDMLARMIAGARLTVLIASAAVVAGAIPGVILGLTAGYFRGPADAVISRVVDAQLSLPFILLALSIITTRGRSVPVLVMVLAIFSWATYARVIRGEAIALRHRPFVLGLIAAGASGRRIVFRHLLPNVAPTILVLASLEVGAVILAESALSFLGLGVVSPDVSWGQMLAEGRDHARRAWWVVTFPGLAITALVLLTNLFGDHLRRRFDPRKKIYG
jgi:peptide/nickel transport system permease protein